MPKNIPQIMDITSIKSILHYLSNEILPSKFERAQQPESNTIQLCFRGINNINWIEVSWQGDCARILSINKPEKLGSNSTLAKQISYGLKYMALIAIKQDKFERIIKFEFAKKPGDKISKILILELMGKHSNFFYLDEKFKIISVGKQIKSNQSSFRTISTGSFYSDPPQNFKKEPDEKESFESWKETLSIIPQSLKKGLISNYQGVSPILTAQIEFLADFKIHNLMNQNIDIISEESLRKIFRIWRIWINKFKNNEFHFSKFNNINYCVWFPFKEVSDINHENIAKSLFNYYDHFLKL